MQGKATEEQLRRAARNQSIFREVNERLEELAEKFQSVAKTAPFSCECADLDCTAMIDLTLNEYESYARTRTGSSYYPGMSTRSLNASCRRTNAMSWSRS